MQSLNFSKIYNLLFKNKFQLTCEFKTSCWKEVEKFEEQEAFKNYIFLKIYRNIWYYP